MKFHYHPANNNNFSELLQVLISCLCTYFINNHMKRFNKKAVSKVPPDKKLSDHDIELFIASVANYISGAVQ